MNEQDVKNLKDGLKDLSKNELIRTIIKAATAVELYKSICDHLKKENQGLKESLKSNNSKE